jgi:hypothetical protein
MRPQSLRLLSSCYVGSLFFRRDIESLPDAEHVSIRRTIFTGQGSKILSIAHAAASKSKKVARDAASENAIGMLKRVAEALGLSAKAAVQL